jgi:hypothetical protein
MRLFAFGEVLPASTRLTLVTGDKPHRSFTMIKFWMDESSGVARALQNGVPSYQVEGGLKRSVLTPAGIRARSAIWRQPQFSLIRNSPYCAKRLVSINFPQKTPCMALPGHNRISNLCY